MRMWQLASAAPSRSVLGHSLKENCCLNGMLSLNQKTFYINLTLPDAGKLPNAPLLEFIIKKSKLVALLSLGNNNTRSVPILKTNACTYTENKQPPSTKMSDAEKLEYC